MCGFFNLGPILRSSWVQIFMIKTIEIGSVLSYNAKTSNHKTAIQ